MKQRLFRLVSLILLIVFFGSCAHKKVDERTGSSAQSQAEENYGPPPPQVPENAAIDPENYGPSRPALRPAVIVLGRGMARSYAAVGFLETLEKARIPVGAILGTEMGSLVASLYATTKSLNQFEWLLMKVKEDAFLEPQSFLSRTKTRAITHDWKDLPPLLNRIFGKKELDEGKVPVWVVSQKENGAVESETKGRCADLVRRSLERPVPEGVLIEEARRLGMGPVIVLDTAEVLQQEQFAGANLVIRPELKGVQEGDFQKRTDIIFSGKNVTVQKMNEIRSQVGLPVGSSQ